VIIDYRVSMALQGGSFSYAGENIVGTEFTVTGLSSSVVYQFKVESRNSYDFSSYSETLTLLSVFSPDPPTTVTTENIDDDVKISWSLPATNGLSITSYRIYIAHHDTISYSEEKTFCKGTSSFVLTNRYCQITLDALRAAPYNLVQGDSVYARIVARNAYGSSDYSAAGNGASLQLVPEPPTSLTNDPTTTSDTTIRFTWSPSSNNGGSAVIDYAVYYDEGTAGSYTLLDSAVPDTFYQTSVVLEAGTTYTFKVTARNSVGSS
jgi:hypothetical protein